jgi:hypothetical protein
MLKMEELLHKVEEGTGLNKELVEMVIHEFNEKLQQFVNIFNFGTTSMLKLNTAFSMPEIINTIESEFK